MTLAAACSVTAAIPRPFQVLIRRLTMERNGVMNASGNAAFVQLLPHLIALGTLSTNRCHTDSAFGFTTGSRHLAVPPTCPGTAAHAAAARAFHWSRCRSLTRRIAAFSPSSRLLTPSI